MSPNDDFTLDTLELAVLARVRRGLWSTDGLACRIDRDGPRLHVRLSGPTVDHWTERAIAVQALEAARTLGCTFGQIDVQYTPLPLGTGTGS